MMSRIAWFPVKHRRTTVVDMDTSVASQQIARESSLSDRYEGCPLTVDERRKVDQRRKN